MTEYARIVSGLVAELFTPPTGVAITDCFHADIAAAFVAVPSGVAPAVGWSHAAGTFSAPAAPPAPSLAQQAAELLAQGCSIVSTGTPALNGTYACDAESRADVQAEMISILVNTAFTNGGTVLAWPDTAGTSHDFDVTQFKAFVTALGGFVGTLKPIVQGSTGALPAQPATIA